MSLDTTKELTLRELWRLLSAEEDITITVDIVKSDYVRQGMAKQKHREMEKLGEFADKTIQYKSVVLPQTEEEKIDGVVRVRLRLIRTEGVTIHKVQVNDTNEFDS